MGDTTKEEHRVCGTVFFFYADDGPCGAVKEPAHRARSAKQAAVIAAACFPIRNILSSAGRSPGEASGADVGIAGGKGEGLLFAKGKILRKVPQEQLVDALFQEIDKL